MASKSQPDAAAQLRAVATEQRRVRVKRGIPRADRLEGFVVVTASEWTLLAILDPAICLDGWTAIRTADVTRVQVRVSDDFVRRALELQGEWPPASVPGLDLGSTTALLQSAADRFPLVTVHTEGEAPDECYIGEVSKITSRTVHLLDIDSDAKWQATPRKWSLRSITRIDVGGRYEAALSAVGGPSPR